ncbi:MAG TPA: M48 family metalloprotease [Bryobacteraceae bacterium]|nr:M48 family metalloprotease [Bryobacteraceae bacterium]
MNRIFTFGVPVRLRTAALCLLPCLLLAQFEPDNAQVHLYFPHFADGGNSQQAWQTSFVFSNPSAGQSSSCTLSTFSDNGSPLNLNLGSGSSSTATFTLPPNGRRTFRSQLTSPAVVTGWAVALCSLPLQGTVLFRELRNGIGQVELSAPSMLPTVRYVSIATRDAGIAIANPYNRAITVAVTAYDSSGTQAGSRQVTLCALCHTSFNPSSFPANFPRNFEGTVVIETTEPFITFAGWTLNSERGLLSSLPDGSVTWPGSPVARIAQAFNKLKAIGNVFFPTANLNAVQLNMFGSQLINAFYTPTTGTVHVSTALAELLNESSSEIAFMLAHELSHHIQARLGQSLIVANKEQDADALGTLLALGVGYDPYAAAGVLGKLSMVTRQSSLIAQYFDDIADPQTSFSTRLTSLFDTLQSMCSAPQAQGACNTYKGVIHPSFPSSIPLTVPRPWPMVEKTLQPIPQH